MEGKRTSEAQGRVVGSEPAGPAELLRRSLTVAGKPFEHVYLESSFLIGADWPRLSQPITNVTALCNLIGIPVHLPEPVMRECEAHWIRDWGDRCLKEQATWRQLNERLKILGFADVAGLSLPTPEQILDQFRMQVRRTLEATQVKLSPLSPRNLESIFRMAIEYVPPFQRDQEGKGFQDTVNWVSVIDHVRASGLTRAVLIAGDKYFEDAAKWSRNNEHVDITILKSADAFTQAVVDHAAAGVRSNYQEQKTRAAAALERQRALLENAVRDKLDVSSLFVGFVKPTSVTSVDFAPVLPEHVQPPFPSPSSGESAVITFKVPAKAHVIIDRFESPPEPPLRVGEARPGLFGLPLPPSFRREEADVDTTLVGEAQAQFRDGDYTILDVPRIRLG